MNMVFYAKGFTKHIRIQKEMQKSRTLRKEGNTAGL